MNRNEEYNKLMEELEHTPIQLEYTMQRAEAKSKERGRRLRKLLAIPLSSCVAILFVFTLLVNSMPVFAYACGSIPVVKELAKFVAFSPSLSAAVENQYVQAIEQEQTQNDITARVEYVIVDPKQLNIFYSLDSKIYTAMEAEPEISNIDGSELAGCGISWGKPGIENGELNYMTIDFTDGDMPKGLYLELKVYNQGSTTKEAAIEEDMFLEEDIYETPEYISEFTFKLEFNPYYTSQGEKITLNEAFVLDHQKLILEDAEIYPTHMRLNFEDVESNTAWMNTLYFYIENEKGRRFDKISNGITATGKVDSPMMASQRLESTFFSQSKNLNMYITGVDWLDKDGQKVKLDLKNVKAEALPEGVAFEKAERKANGWLLTFAAKEFEENSSYQIWDNNYYDEEGNQYELNSWSSGHGGYYDEEQEKYIETPGIFRVEIPLKDYPYDIVYMSPIFTRKVELEQPVVLKIK